MSRSTIIHSRPHRVFWSLVSCFRWETQLDHSNTVVQVAWTYRSDCFEFPAGTRLVNQPPSCNTVPWLLTTTSYPVRIFNLVAFLLSSHAHARIWTVVLGSPNNAVGISKVHASCWPKPYLLKLELYRRIFTSLHFISSRKYCRPGRLLYHAIARTFLIALTSSEPDNQTWTSNPARPQPADSSGLQLAQAQQEPAAPDERSRLTQGPQL